jgi:hypothetical protein
MQYKQFFINAFQVRRGGWRVIISRSDGTPLAFKSQGLSRTFVTGTEEKTAADALLVAIDMIDWGTVWAAPTKASEKKTLQDADILNFG